MKVENINSASSSVYELYLMRLSRFKDDKEQLEMDLEEVKNVMICLQRCRALHSPILINFPLPRW